MEFRKRSPTTACNFPSMPGSSATAAKPANFMSSLGWLAKKTCSHVGIDDADGVVVLHLEAHGHGALVAAHADAEGGGADVSELGAQAAVHEDEHQHALTGNGIGPARMLTSGR
mmetsp:Transcript_112056/g.361889  ORF Transcript_112056/g.361889 Transcript_112056/m.361889 type:complete len:114 (-) Transcript_112056:284-625(-)